jgi:hypothetical protein
MHNEVLIDWREIYISSLLSATGACQGTSLLNVPLIGCWRLVVSVMCRSSRPRTLATAGAVEPYLVSCAGARRR